MEYDTLSVEQLRELITLAKANNQEAIDRLCQQFQPLVTSEANRPDIKRILQEDAENTAWEIFLSIIHKYNKDCFERFPGYVQTTLYHNLRKRTFHNALLYEELGYDTLENMSSTFDATYEQVETKLMQEHYLSKLSPYQQEIVTKRYIEGDKRLNMVSYSSPNKYYKNLYKAQKIIMQTMKKEKEK